MACTSGVTQGSVLGPLLFTAYVSPVSRLIDCFGVGYHQFTDDARLCVAMDAANANDQLTSCTAAVKRWFLLNDLLLNADKSDIVVVRTAQQLRSAAIPTAVDVAGCSLQVSTHIKSLGVVIDAVSYTHLTLPTIYSV